MLKRWFQIPIPSTYLALITISMIPVSAYFLFKYGDNFAIDYFSNILATYLGVIFAVNMAVWTDRYNQNKSEKERKRRILLSLRNEINVNWTYVKIWLDEKQFSDEIFTLSINLRDELWKSFSDGGELEWIKDTQLLAELSNTYYAIRSLRESSEKYFHSTSFANKSQGRLYIKQLELLIKEQLENSKNSFARTFAIIDSNI